jgi:DNA phosphorothioation-associated putative methyltransferase
MIVDFPTIVERCQNSNIGKLLPAALYIHTKALNVIDPILRQYERLARNLIRKHFKKIGENPELYLATLVKFATEKPQISYLFYLNFDRDPHPKLLKSIIVNLETKQVSQRDYYQSDNPPILHRKETFVTADYPHYQEFARLTQEETALGLLDNSRVIGTNRQWRQLLLHHNLDFAGHYIICPINPDFGGNNQVEIDRHRAALYRKELSRPVRIALEAGLFHEGTTFFDYGCGHGRDINEIRDRGYNSEGWDPYYAPETSLVSADIVNLGYVINVIENLQERREALIKAWELTQRVLIVSAQVLIDDRQKGTVAYADGIITTRNTFQKYYEQEELKTYVNSILKVDAIAVGLGVFLIFKNSTEAETFRASCFVSRVSTPRVYREVKQFADYQKLLTPLMAFYTKRGRLPVTGELPEEAAIKEEFKTYRRAFKVILQATEEKEWEAIANKRRQDLLVYLALANFKGRSSRKIAPEIKADAKALLEGYQQACVLADLLLLNVKDLDKIAHLCSNSSIGKQLDGAIAIHISALDQLPPLLRVYEGCASRVYGRLSDANIIKLYYNKPKISYLYYPHFDTIAHPTLQTTMEIDLQNYSVIFNDLSRHPNPLVLHHKDALVPKNYYLYQDFTQLINYESELGLLADNNLIRRHQEWKKLLQKNQLEIEEHRISCSLSCHVACSLQVA